MLDSASVACHPTVTPAPPGYHCALPPLASSSPSPDDLQHVTVLRDHSVFHLAAAPGQVLVDATFGGGGHTRALLEATAPSGHVLALDRDPQAIASGQTLVEEFQPRLSLYQANYTSLPSVLADAGYARVDGILADLGVSTRQLLDPARGFSFRNEGPTDMRMGPDADWTAAELIAASDEQELVEQLKEAGEHRYARRIARGLKALVRDNPQPTTTELASAVHRSVGAARTPDGRDRATRTFLALRLAVNNELGDLAALLSAAPGLLRRGGRLAIITFHSLEDRMVKRAFQELCQRCSCPPRQPVCTCPGTPRARWVAKKVREEATDNRRARSATLRVIEMLEEPTP